ncbi:hypothetical protein Bca52824_071931 [Brassica carinata]|uniref:NFD4 C-terminal domain-containing protein n=1 Tax=Brassica carinata TaxID=52824 RepID=A0A8X7Q8I9_BRACI|nr:hypothetical protein Bca52824_071931 [Brassica carinata]
MAEEATGGGGGGTQQEEEDRRRHKASGGGGGEGEKTETRELGRHSNGGGRRRRIEEDEDDGIDTATRCIRRYGGDGSWRRRLARLLFGGSILLLILLYAFRFSLRRNWNGHRVKLAGGYQLLSDDIVLRTAITPVQKSFIEDNNSRSCCSKLITRNQLGMLGRTSSVYAIVQIRLRLYYIAYFCGGTIGLVYSNNLGQIAQSLGQSSETTTLVTLYSSFSFFGRLLSATPDYIRPLQAGTALIGLSSGFIFAAAVSITSELFGPNSVGVNHNILITNIPIGSLVYGFLAALVYESHSTAGSKTGSVICMGRDCYFLTFVWWGCLSVIGLASSVVLFLRTRRAYQRFEQDRIASSMLYS